MQRQTQPVLYSFLPQRVFYDPFPLSSTRVRLSRRDWLLPAVPSLRGGPGGTALGHGEDAEGWASFLVANSAFHASPIVIEYLLCASHCSRHWPQGHPHESHTSSLSFLSHRHFLASIPWGHRWASNLSMEGGQVLGQVPADRPLTSFVQKLMPVPRRRSRGRLRSRTDSPPAHESPTPVSSLSAGERGVSTRTQGAALGTPGGCLPGRSTHHLCPCPWPPSSSAAGGGRCRGWVPRRPGTLRRWACLAERHPSGDGTQAGDQPQGDVRAPPPGRAQRACYGGLFYTKRATSSRHAGNS